jgi:hypothetical protein
MDDSKLNRKRKLKNIVEDKDSSKKKRIKEINPPKKAEKPKKGKKERKSKAPKKKQVKEKQAKQKQVKEKPQIGLESITLREFHEFLNKTEECEARGRDYEYTETMQKMLHSFGDSPQPNIEIIHLMELLAGLFIKNILQSLVNTLISEEKTRKQIPGSLQYPIFLSYFYFLFSFILETHYRF